MEDEKTSFLSSYWQDLNTYVERDGISPREKAEGYRRILNFLDKSRSSKIISEKLYHALYSDAHQKYTSVIDCMNEEEGMNNYMASIKELVSGLRNNSHSWKTSLCMKDSEDIPSFLSEILEKAKINDQSENQSVSLKYRSTATNISENTRKAYSEDKASSKQAQRLQANSSASFVAPSSASVSRNRNATAEGANASRCIQNNMFGSAVEKGQAAKSSTASQFVSGDGNASRNPSRFSRGINGNDKTAEGSLQTQMNASSGIHQQAVFTKRKFEGNLNSSNKQARLEPNISNRIGVSDQPSRGKFTNGCPSTLNLYANSRNEMQDSRERLDQRHELAQGSSSRQYSNPSDKAERNDDIENHETPSTNTFLTARDQYMIEQRAKNRSVSEGRSIRQSDYGVTKKSLGTRRGTSNKFIPPVMNKQQNDTMAKSRTNSSLKNSDHGEGMDERLKNIDQRMIEMIENEIMDHGPAVTWDDIAGLEFAKNTIQEIVIWPMLRPDIFKGLRGPPKGLLLFGPPGTGKTLIGKCIASQSHATFFSISASSLTSKWIGDGEKMVRALFGVARCQESAVIFIDEIDSLLSQRSDGEHEATRRIKTEFLIQLDGATTKAEERILVVGATNRPQELDEAARRRLVKRLYIPLPEAEARKQIVSNLMTEQKCSLDENDLNMIMENSHGYSGADMANLCREAALGPIRSISRQDIRFIKSDEVRPIIYKDFEDAFKNIRPSVSQKDLEVYTQWNKQYGSGGV